jgi:hypothetical protein
VTNARPTQPPLRVPLWKRMECVSKPTKGRKPCPLCGGLDRHYVWVLKGESTYKFTSDTCEACGHEFYEKKV